MIFSVHITTTTPIMKNTFYALDCCIIIVRLTLFSSGWLLEHLPYRCRHNRSSFWGVLTLKTVRHLLKRDPFNAFMLVDIIDYPRL
jgi:hypothetical protein